MCCGHRRDFRKARRWVCMCIKIMSIYTYTCVLWTSSTLSKSMQVGVCMCINNHVLSFPPVKTRFSNLVLRADICDLNTMHVCV